MKTMLSLAVAFVLLVPCSVWAVKEQVDLTPENLQRHEGFEIKAVERDNGTIGFTVTRDPSKARWNGRDGRLEVQGESGLAAECYVEGKDEAGKIRYWFAVSPKYLEYTHFTIAELQSAEGEGPKIELIGGGTFYRIRVKDFMPKISPTR